MLLGFVATGRATLEGAEMKNPPASFASGGGLETLSSLLSVSALAGSARSRLSRSSRLSESNAHGGERDHSERKHSKFRREWKGGDLAGSGCAPN